MPNTFGGVSVTGRMSDNPELLQPHPEASRLDATVPIEAIDPTHPDHYERDWCSRGFCDCRSAVSP